MCVDVAELYIHVGMQMWNLVAKIKEFPSPGFQRRRRRGPRGILYKGMILAAPGVISTSEYRRACVDSVNCTLS
jgi:hypothetical protein